MPASDPSPVINRAIIVGIIYFVAASAMILLTRFDNGVASLWLATAPLVAMLAIAERRQAVATVIACGVGGVAATTMFGFGPAGAIPMLIANIGEATIGAALLRHFGRQRDYLDSLEGVAIFALAAAAIPSAIAAIPAAMFASPVNGVSFWVEWRSWFAGHALGTLSFAPIATLAINGDFGRWLRELRTPRSGRSIRGEAILWLALMVAVCVAVFLTSTTPLLFVPMLPLMVVSFRLDRPGTAIAIVIIAVIGGGLTLLGYGPLTLVTGAAGWRMQLFQVYLAFTALTAFPVAAELTQRKEIFSRLLESEARYKLITESATDIIVTLDLGGIIRYASPSVREITGFRPEDLIGHKPDELLAGPDAARLAESYRRAIDRPGASSTTEYRAMVASGENRWFEANTRCIVDAAGSPTGWVSAIRDISERKSLEFKLAHAATTDPLTGLANRRKFDSILDRKIAERRTDKQPGCVAIFDIDFFKRVNDEHGHAVGDMVLETFAAAALRVVRSGDHVARLGGEEFGLILHGVDVDCASRICDRLRDAISRDVTLTPDGASIVITVSAGIAEIAPGASRLQILRAADEALYRAKAGGRDQLAIAA
ncbi:MAG: hypothetical protein B7Y45_11105 [Sphingomonas sp. 28-66-16]|nr:MAG: hypothetical protein B7Y45_11105 [Sphingomonas sp. 28-66-16]